MSWFTIPEVLSSQLKLIAFGISLVSVAFAQGAPSQQPQVRVNYLNVCTPPDADKLELQNALSRVPLRPQFAPDFEVARGSSSMDEDSIIAGAGAQMQDQKPATSRWVRIRREYPSASPFSIAQYAFSVTEGRVTETISFRIRDPKELLSVTLSASAAAGSDPAQAASANTAPERIRIERFGKSSVVLARCPSADQASYESLFKTAADIFSRYRNLLNTAKSVPLDLARIPSAEPAASKPHAAPARRK